jgi:hypothetical protein
MSRTKKAIVTVLALAAFASSVSSALAAAPGPGDKQCRGATGNDNPHCPPGK